MFPPVNLDDLHIDDPDIVTAEFYVRSLHNHGWTESVVVVRDIPESRNMAYATVTRTYNPLLHLDTDTTETRILIQPQESTHGRSARGHKSDAVTTNLIMVKRKPNGGMRELEKMADQVKYLSKQIVDWLECRPLFNASCSPCNLHGRWLNATRPQVFSLPDVHQRSLFATIMQLQARCDQSLCCCED